MGVVAGSNMLIKVSNTAFTKKSDGVIISNMDKSTVKEACEIVEITGFGDTFKKRMAGIRDAEMKLSGALNRDDAGQVMLYAGATVYVSVFPEGLTKNGRQICMIVEDVETSSEVSGKQEISVNLKANGEPTNITA